MKRSPGQAQLSRDQWANEALNVIAEFGTDAVSIEKLAASLGVTKGSFYWHFTSRSELIQAALQQWEHVATTAIIEQLTQHSDPIERLQALLIQSLGEPGDTRSENAIFGSISDPLVMQSVNIVNNARQAFLTKIFLDLGHTRAIAETRARIAYAAYLGHVTLQMSGSLNRRSANRFINELVKTLTSPA